jgi:hypothetical protein
METDKSVGAIMGKLTCPRKGFIDSARVLFHIKLYLSIGRGKEGGSGVEINSLNSHFTGIYSGTRC